MLAVFMYTANALVRLNAQADLSLLDAHIISLVLPNTGSYFLG